MEGRSMRTNTLWLKRIAELGLILMMGVSMSASAGLFGFGGTSWKEEVLLHDGSKIIVKRSQSYGGRHEVGQGAPVKEHSITFDMPNSGKTLTFKSEYSEDVGRANFNLLALHILNGTPYLVVEPNLCLSYNKWGRPNPPYVFFKHDGKEWQRIPITEFPAEFKTINLIVSNKQEQDIERAARKLGYVSAESIQHMNNELTQPQLKTIRREVWPKESIDQMCMEMILYKGYWIMPNDPVARSMVDSKIK
jgi:hypothetical protein